MLPIGSYATRSMGREPMRESTSIGLGRRDSVNPARRRLKTRRRAGADEFAFIAPDIAEAVRQRAFEIIRVAGPENPRLAADGELDFSLDDDTPLLARVRQHFLSGIGTRGVALVKDRHAALGQAAADEAQLDARSTDITEFLPGEEHLRLAAEIQGEKVGERHGNTVEDLLQGTDRRAHPVLLDQGNQAVGHAGTFRQLALRQPVHLPYGFQVGTYVQAHDVYYNRHTLVNLSEN